MATPEKNTQRVYRKLSDATAKASDIIVKSMQDEELPINTRLDLAKEVLNRVYGKSVQLSPTQETNEIHVVADEEVKSYMV